MIRVLLRRSQIKHGPGPEMKFIIVKTQYPNYDSETDHEFVQNMKTQDRRVQ